MRFVPISRLDTASFLEIKIESWLSFCIKSCMYSIIGYTLCFAKATRVQPVTGTLHFLIIEIRLYHQQCLKEVLVLDDTVTVVYKESLLHNVFFVIVRVSSCKLQYTIISRTFFLRLMVVTLDSIVNIFKSYTSFCECESTRVDGNLCDRQKILPPSSSTVGVIGEQSWIWLWHRRLEMVLRTIMDRPTENVTLGLLPTLDSLRPLDMVRPLEHWPPSDCSYLIAPTFWP
jgi:hypothetical protein